MPPSGKIEVAEEGNRRRGEMTPSEMRQCAKDVVAWFQQHADLDANTLAEHRGQVQSPGRVSPTLIPGPPGGGPGGRGGPRGNMRPARSSQSSWAINQTRAIECMHSSTSQTVICVAPSRSMSLRHQPRC